MVSLLFECIFVHVKRSSYVQVSGVPITQIKIKPASKQGELKDTTFQRVIPRPLYFSKWRVTRDKKAKHQAQELFKNTTSPSRRGAKRLLLDIFVADSAKRKTESARKKYEHLTLKPWMHQLVGTMQKLIRNHLHCKYAVMLSAVTTHFNLDVEATSSKPGGDKDALMALLGQHTPKHEVVRFLWCAFNRVIPKKLFGASPHNRATLRQVLKQYVGLKKKEHMRTSHLIHGLRTSEVPWLLRSAGENARIGQGQRRIALGKMAYWLFDSFFCPLVKSFFYCTDTSPEHSRIYYYHHQLWKKIKELAVNRLVATSLLERVPSLPYAGVPFSHLRILPKATGIRPILNMTRNSSSCLKLKGPFSVLTFEKVKKKSHKNKLNTTIIEQERRRFVQKHAVLTGGRLCQGAGFLEDPFRRRAHQAVHCEVRRGAQLRHAEPEQGD